MDAYILTGSFFVECLPPENPEAVKLLFSLITETILRKVSVYATVDFDKELYKHCVEIKQEWIYEYIRKIYIPCGLTTDKNPVQSIVDLANLKCELYEKLIIVNGSNIFKDAKFRKLNIEVKSSKDTLEFLLGK